MSIGIYMIENQINHKRYIGKTIDFNHRVYLHLHYLNNNRHSNTHLQKSWNKYGSENFKIVLFDDRTDECRGKDIDYVNSLLNDLEIAWIKFYKSSDENFGYNLSEGGDGATLFGERNPSFGKPKSHLVKMKISNTINKNRSHSGERNGRYGKPVSAETRKKISQANTGRVQSAEERANRSKAMKLANKKPENIKRREERKNDPIRKQRYIELGKKQRKYTDEFISQVRSEYVSDLDIPVLAEKYNMPNKTCMEMVHRNGHFKNR